MKHLSRILAAALLCLLPLSALAETVPEETVPETALFTEPVETEPETMFTSPYPLYFGLLHAHTDLSDGLGTVEEAFSYASAEGLDFFAVTDHSNSLDEAEWSRGREAARAASTEAFLALWGYEMTWQEDKRIGHIAAFGTGGLLSRDQAAFSNPSTGLEAYYRALSEDPGAVAMLCHPGEYYGNFHSFGHYSPEYDRQVHLLEVASGGDGTFYDQYVQALDKGWHLAPSANENDHNGSRGSESGVRTVVLAEALTEESLLEAIRAHRVYATEDRDLHLYYDLDGHILGSEITQALEPEITVLAWDPTDQAIGTVEVVTEGGRVLARETAGENDVYLTIPVSGGFRYYFLRITQPDGDVAVTAPVWVEGFENLGIRDFSPETRDPQANQPLTLHLTLYNEERADYLLEALELYADGTLIQTIESPGTVPAGGTLTLSISHTHPDPGQVELKARVRGSILGQSRSCSGTLTLRFRSDAVVTGVLVDGRHENRGLEEMERLLLIASEEGQDLTLIEGELPQGGSLLLIPDPGKPFEEDFLRDVRAFAQSGGDLILWGEKALLDPLLEYLDLSMRVGMQTLSPGTAQVFNADSPWCAPLAEGQYFSNGEFLTVEPGAGTWLVRQRDQGPVLLCCEETAWGGTVFLSGGPFLLDAQLPEPVGIWELPSANETLLRVILGAQPQILAVRPIQSVRDGPLGAVFRVKGHVTAGTADPNNRFPDVIYLQDDSGGIAVTGFGEEPVQVGQPIEVIGTLSREGGNIVLQYNAHRILKERHYRWAPGTLSCGTAGDYAVSGGSLVQVEGRILERMLTEDGKGVSRLVLRDFRGEEAIVEIEPYIFSRITGENRLARELLPGRTARALGIVHINEAGETVIRVRNCDEVVYVPPTVDASNPDTGDRAWWKFFR